MEELTNVGSQEMGQFRDDKEVLEDMVSELSTLIDEQKKELDLESDVKKIAQDAMGQLEDAFSHAEAVNEIIKDLERAQPEYDNSNAITSKLSSAAKHEVEIRKDLKNLHNDLTKLGERASELHEEYEKEAELEHDEEEFFSAVQDIKGHIKKLDEKCEVINSTLKDYREQNGSDRNVQRDEVLGN